MTVTHLSTWPRLYDNESGTEMVLHECRFLALTIHHTAEALYLNFMKWVEKKLLFNTLADCVDDDHIEAIPSMLSGTEQPLCCLT